MLEKYFLLLAVLVGCWLVAVDGQNDQSLRDPASIYGVIAQGQAYRDSLTRRKHRLNENLRYVHDFDTTHLYQLVEMQIDDFNAFETLLFGMLDIYGNTVKQPGSAQVPSGTKGGPFHHLYDYRTPALRLTYDFQLAIKASHDKFRSTPWDQVQTWATKETKQQQQQQQNEKHEPVAPIGQEQAQSESDDEGESMKAILNAMLQDVSNSADQLEHDMHQHSLKFASGHLETVLKVDDNKHHKQKDASDASAPHSHQDEIPGEDNAPVEDIPSIVTLIDQDQNEYIMTRPFDTTVIYEDMQFLHDIILILVVSFALGMAFAMVGLPAFFGYILAGILLGPSCYNHIKELIQTETLAQLGVVLIVFVLGLECSLDKLQSMWRMAVGGASLMLFITVSCFVTLGMMFGTTIKESVFIGACLSLSSTAVVVKVIPVEHLEHLYGLLVMQDVLLGFMLAMVPALTKSGVQVMKAMLHISASFVLFAALCYALVRYAIPMVPRLLHRFLPPRVLNHLMNDWYGDESSRHELAVLGALAICLLMSTISEHLGLGMELGCFAAGVMIRTSASSSSSSSSASNGSNGSSSAAHARHHRQTSHSHSLYPQNHHQHASTSSTMTRSSVHETLLAVVTPVRDLFACLFFASMGLHIYPSFLASELVLLLTLTATVIGFKYIVTASVLLIFKFDMQACSTMAVALAQISEFVFVLASRAKQLQIISREVYYLLLATTSLTLMATPLLWKLTHRQKQQTLDDHLPEHHDNGNKFA
ncbi:Sodium/hydrogen exchanger family-domain-containing protein [Gongronella butleri]|nr:Sodium/hydrogen exchanger family-domain-containing protein [Gongronella butleri]